MLISTYCFHPVASRFVVVQGCPSSWDLHGLPKLTLNLHPTTTLFPKVSRGPIVSDLHSKHSTFRSFRGRRWNKIKSTKFHAHQFAVSLSSLHIRGVWVFTHATLITSWRNDLTRKRRGRRRDNRRQTETCSLYLFSQQRNT